MCELDLEQNIWQEWFQEGYELGFKQGLSQKTQEIVRKMLIKGFAIALIVDFTALTIEQIQKLQAQAENTEIQ